MAPIDLISCLIADELTRRGDRLLERRRKQAAFRDPLKTLVDRPIRAHFSAAASRSSSASILTRRLAKRASLRRACSFSS